MSSTIDDGQKQRESATAEIRVLVGYDGTESSQRALEAASQMLHGRRGRMEVLYVGHTPTSAAYSAAALVEVSAALDETERELAHQVGEVLDGEGIQWHFQRRDGEIADQLMAVAEELVASSSPDARIAVVVGGTSRRIDRYLNSVPGRLIRHDRFRVVVIP